MQNNSLNTLWALCLAAALTPALAQTAKTTSASKSAGSPTAQAAPSCLVANFRTMALETHHPEERSAKSEAWLKINGANCSLEQILIIRANRAHWMGNADSASLMGMIDGMTETRLKNQPLLMAQIYSAQATENKASTDTTSTTPNAAALPAKPNAAPAAPVTAVVVAPAAAAAAKP